MMVSLALEPLDYIRIGVLVMWGFGGLFAYWNVSREHGWGVALLAFGSYLALGWIAVRP